MSNGRRLPIRLGGLLTRLEVGLLYAIYLQYHKLTEIREENMSTFSKSSTMGLMLLIPRKTASDSVIEKPPSNLRKELGANDFLDSRMKSMTLSV